jgi:signal peptidase II
LKNEILLFMENTEIKITGIQKKVVWCYITAATLMFADQLSKILIKGFSLFGLHHEGMQIGESIQVLGDFLQITYIENAGMAFGITFGVWKIFLSIFSIIAAILLGWLLAKIKDSNFWIKLGFTLIFAGATGNLIDRVFYGVFYGEGILFYGLVVDFIQFQIPEVTIFGTHYTHFPVFNIADSCVTVGVALLIIMHKKLPDLSNIFKKNQLEQVTTINSSENIPNIGKDGE